MNERPNVGGVSSRSRNERCSVSKGMRGQYDGRMTKRQATKEYAPASPPPNGLVDADTRKTGNSTKA